MSAVILFQGCSKVGQAPDGTSYVDAAEKDEIKQLLRWWEASDFRAQKLRLLVVHKKTCDSRSLLFPMFMSLTPFLQLNINPKLNVEGLGPSFTWKLFLRYFPLQSWDFRATRASSEKLLWCKGVFMSTVQQYFYSASLNDCAKVDLCDHWNKSITIYSSLVDY